MKTHLTIVSLIALAAGGGAFAQHVQSVSYAEAYAEAVASNRRLIVYFQGPAEGNKSTAAATFEGETLEDAAVNKKLQDKFVFVAVRPGEKVGDKLMTDFSAFKEFAGQEGFVILGANNKGDKELFPKSKHPFVGSTRPWERARFLALLSAGDVLPIQPSRAQIVNFCESNIGRRVGSGDCYQLIEGAYRSAGVSRVGSNQPVQPGDVVWNGSHWRVIGQRQSDGKLRVYDQNWRGGRPEGQKVRVQLFDSAPPGQRYRPSH